MAGRLKSGAIAFIASGVADARKAQAELTARYGGAAPEAADVIVALGGDGFMLETLHAFMNTGKPIYGMHCGSVGFLMNDLSVDGLPSRLEAAVESVVHPLKMRAIDASGATHEAYAINEVSLIRQSFQAAKIEVAIDGQVRLKELIADEILVATPAGSTAYNLSAHGPILPIYAPLLALTPLSAFRPRTWRGALLPDNVEVRLTALESDKRPINAAADNVEFKSVVEVRVKQDRKAESLVLFDPDHSWDERILSEQFRYQPPKRHEGRLINTRRQILQWTGAGAGAVALGSLKSVFAATVADRMIVVSNGGGAGVPPSMTLIDPDTLEVLVTVSAPGAFSFPATRWGFSRDIIWGGYQEKIAAFSLATGEQVAAAETKSAQNYTEVTPDGRFVLSAARLVDKVFKVAASGPNLGGIVEVVDHYAGAGPCDVTITKDGKYAFTADRLGETISTWEVDPLTKVATTAVERRGTVPLEPYMTTVSPRGDYLFVENARGNGSESVFDIRDPLHPVEVVRWDQSDGLGTTPLTDEFSPDGRFNLIMNRGSSDLTVVDVDQLRIRGRVALPDGSNPMTGVFTPVGTRFFVPLPGRDAVAVIAVPEFEIVKMIPVGTRPMGAVYLENPLPRRQGMITPLGSALEQARVFPVDCPDECCGPL